MTNATTLPIGSIMSGWSVSTEGSNTPKPSSKSVAACLSDASRRVVTAYGTSAQFRQTFSPVRQFHFASYPRQCYLGSAPALAHVAIAYGHGVANAWLMEQLADLAEFSGSTGKMSPAQLRACAYSIASAYAWLNVAEIMLFFARFKSGRYGRFYQSVDPLIVTNALREFVGERFSELQKYEYEENAKKREEQREGTISRAEYERLLWLAVYGDEAAQQLLTPPVE